MSEGSTAGSLSYRDAGVDIDAAEAALDASKDAIRATHGPRVLADVGSFGGLFRVGGQSGGDPNPRTGTPPDPYGGGFHAGVQRNQ